MELRSPHEPEHTNEQCFQMVADASFDACMVNVISGVMPIKPEDAVVTVRRCNSRTLYQKCGLTSAQLIHAASLAARSLRDCLSEHRRTVQGIHRY